jgi:hypothetical protein
LHAGPPSVIFNNRLTEEEKKTMKTEDDVWMSIDRVSTFEHTSCYGYHEGPRLIFWLICDGYIMHGIETNIKLWYYLKSLPGMYKYEAGICLSLY